MFYIKVRKEVNLLKEYIKPSVDKVSIEKIDEIFRCSCSSGDDNPH